MVSRSRARRGMRTLPSTRGTRGSAPRRTMRPTVSSETWSTWAAWETVYTAGSQLASLCRWGPRTWRTARSTAASISASTELGLGPPAAPAAWSSRLSIWGPAGDGGALVPGQPGGLLRSGGRRAQPGGLGPVGAEADGSPVASRAVVVVGDCTWGHDAPPKWQDYWQDCWHGRAAHDFSFCWPRAETAPTGRFGVVEPSRRAGDVRSGPGRRPARGVSLGICQKSCQKSCQLGQARAGDRCGRSRPEAGSRLFAGGPGSWSTR